MDSFQMCDNQRVNQNMIHEVKKAGLMNNGDNIGCKQQAELLKQNHSNFQGVELSEFLNAPEISLDLHTIIDNPQFNDRLFNDILRQGRHLQNLHPRPAMDNVSNYPRATLPYTPQSVHSGSVNVVNQNSNSASNSSAGSDVPSVKEEPADPQDYRRHCNMNSFQNNYNPAYPDGYGAYTNVMPGVLNNPLLNNNSMKHVSRRVIKSCDKNSEEYRRRREKNNDAVRKCRVKANLQKKQTEEKVSVLLKENQRLEKSIAMLSEELTALMNLFSNVGVLPNHVHREMSKLQLQQHQQIPEDRSRLMDVVHDYGS